MASSRYSAYVGFSNKNIVSEKLYLRNTTDYFIQMKDKEKTLITDNASITPGISEAISKGKFQHVLVNANGQHTCRETLLSAVNNLCSNYSTTFPMLSLPVLYINYLAEGQRDLEKGHIEEMLKFDDIFFNSTFDNNLFRVFNHKEGFVISVEVGGANQFRYNLAVLSMILWIFRNRSILNACIEHGQKISLSLQSLFRYLCGEFLKNPSWGDAANPNVYLSLFCYTMGYNTTFSSHTVYQNGAVNYAQYNSQPLTVMTFVENILVKEFAKEGAIPWRELNGVNCASSGATKVMDKLFHFYLRELEEQEKRAKKEAKLMEKKAEQLKTLREKLRQSGVE